MWTLILGLLLAGAAVQEEPEPYPGVADPLAFVRGGYDSPRALSGLDTYASTRLRAELHAHDEAAGGEDLGILNWWVDGGEERVTGLDVRRLPGTGPDRQTLLARFRNHGRPVALRFSFVREGAAWYLDEVVNLAGRRSWTLTSLLRLRPAGGARPAGWDRVAEAGGGTIDPFAFVAHNYFAYSHADDEAVPIGDRVNSRRLRALFAAYDAAASPDEVGAVDFDWWVNGQDWSLSDLLFAEEEGGPHRRVIAARFRNLGRPSLIRFHFVEEDGRWFLDDVMSGDGRGPDDWTLSALLRQRP
ncbi:MAG TPA: hypothetical protein VJS15_00565 [Allosphingosinicella sp.]|nr:hypothetical protein [Allosphingosinicella sp.]